MQSTCWTIWGSWIEMWRFASAGSSILTLGRLMRVWRYVCTTPHTRELYKVSFCLCRDANGMPMLALACMEVCALQASQHARICRRKVTCWTLTTFIRQCMARSTTNDTCSLIQSCGSCFHLSICLVSCSRTQICCTQNDAFSFWEFQTASRFVCAPIHKFCGRFSNFHVAHCASSSVVATFITRTFQVPERLAISDNSLFRFFLCVFICHALIEQQCSMPWLQNS